MPTITIEFPEEDLVYKDVALAVSDITNAGFVYLLRNGYSQSLVDSAAGLAKKIKEEVKKAGGSDDEGEEAARDKVIERFVEKAQAIASGNVDLRVRDEIGQTAFEKARDSVVRDYITTVLLAGKTIPRASKNSTDVEREGITNWWNRNIAGVYAKHNDVQDFDSQARELVLANKAAAAARKGSKVSLETDLV